MSIELIEAIFRFKINKLKENQHIFLQISNIPKS